MCLYDNIPISETWVGIIPVLRDTLLHPAGTSINCTVIEDFSQILSFALPYKSIGISSNYFIEKSILLLLFKLYGHTLIFKMISRLNIRKFVT